MNLFLVLRVFWFISVTFICRIHAVPINFDECFDSGGNIIRENHMGECGRVWSVSKDQETEVAKVEFVNRAMFGNMPTFSPNTPCPRGSKPWKGTCIFLKKISSWKYHLATKTLSKQITPCCEIWEDFERRKQQITEKILLTCGPNYRRHLANSFFNFFRKINIWVYFF